MSKFSRFRKEQTETFEFLSKKQIRRIKRSNIQELHEIQETVNNPNKKIQPKNNNQKRLIDSINKNNFTITIGSAGTGKTFIPTSIAAEQFLDKKIHKIYITRPNVPAGKSIGFFPGDLNEKMTPWVSPITSVLQEVMSKSVYEYQLKRGNIEIVPFEVIRGRTFDDCFVILDEAENTTVQEMKAFLTRIGENCTVIVNGDIAQKDIKESSGLKMLVDLWGKSTILKDKIGLVEFTIDDVVRSGIVKDFLMEFDRVGV